MAKTSVIVPVYNTEKYLQRCIDSILRQTYNDLELILVDDGSTDHSGEICEENARNDKRVKVFHQKNQGQAVARNLALDWIEENSDSEWIMFVDSDDWVHPKIIEILCQNAIHNHVPISVGGYAEINGEERTPELGKSLNSILYKTEDFYCQNQDMWAVIPWGKLFRKECISGIRFPAVRACEDEAFTYKVLFRSMSIAVIDAPLYYYFMREDSTMHKEWTPDRMAFIPAIKERLLFFEENKYMKAYDAALTVYLYGALQDHIHYLDRIGLDAQYKKEKQRMIMILRKELLWYWKKGKISPEDSKYVALFEEMFPTVMRLFWYYNSLVYKIKRK